MTSFSFEMSASFVAVGSDSFENASSVSQVWASDFFNWQFLKSHQKSKFFLFYNLLSVCSVAVCFFQCRFTSHSYH